MRHNRATPIKTYLPGIYGALAFDFAFEKGEGGIGGIIDEHAGSSIDEETAF